MKTLLLLLSAFTLLNSKDPNTNDMGILNKFFGPRGTSNAGPATDTSGLEKTADMLDEETYWGLIDASLKASRNQREQEQYLIRELGRLTSKEMIGFRLRTDRLLYDTYTSDMWCAGYIMNGGCSDDGFEYFRNWVISRGKDVYYQAKEHPDSLVSQVRRGVDSYEFESFWYVALNAFEAKTGKDLYDYIDNEKFTTREGNYPPIQFTWQEGRPESLKKICPKLFACCWDN
jgi:hypothetical protein